MPLIIHGALLHGNTSNEIFIELHRLTVCGRALACNLNHASWSCCSSDLPRKQLSGWSCPIPSRLPEFLPPAGSAIPRATQHLSAGTCKEKGKIRWQTRDRNRTNTWISHLQRSEGSYRNMLQHVFYMKAVFTASCIFYAFGRWMWWTRSLCNVKSTSN